MRDRSQATGDINERYESPTQSPGEELEYSYATPEDNHRITHTYLTCGKKSGEFGDQELEYSYAKPEVDSTYQDLDSVKQARPYQNI